MHDPSFSRFVTIHSRYTRQTETTDDILWQQPGIIMKLQRSANKNSNQILAQIATKDHQMKQYYVRPTLQENNIPQKYVTYKSCDGGSNKDGVVLDFAMLYLRNGARYSLQIITHMKSYMSFWLQHKLMTLNDFERQFTVLSYRVMHVMIQRLRLGSRGFLL